MPELNPGVICITPEFELGDNIFMQILTHKKSQSPRKSYNTGVQE